MNQQDINLDCPLAPNQFLSPSRGKVRMGVEQWKSSVSTPSQALPLQGGGDISANGLSGIKQNTLWRAALLCAALACHATAGHAERADRDKPMHLEANQVSVDDAKQISTFEGDVQFTQGTILIRGDKIVVTQSKDGFMHGTVTGQSASFRQKREGSDEYVEGYGERIEYDSKTETLDLFGQARMKMRQDEVSGEHITYSSRTEIFQVHGMSGGQTDASADTQGKGRVRAIIQPKNRKAADDSQADTPARPGDNQ